MNERFLHRGLFHIFHSVHRYFLHLGFIVGMHSWIIELGIVISNGRDCIFFSLCVVH